jgi:hypothetical protein
MCGTVLCVAAVALGIDVGWQPLPDGGMEYVIQLEPQTVDLLRSGVEIPSDIPAYLKDLRRLRITVGNAALARKIPAEAVSGPAFPTSPGGPFPRLSLKQRASHLFLDALFPPYHPVSVRPPEVRTEVRPRSGNAGRGTEGGGGGTEDAGRGTGLRQKPAGERPLAEQPPVSWTLTVGALIGAVAAAIFLAWIAWEYRIRYRRLLAQFLESGRGLLGHPGRSIEHR